MALEYQNLFDSTLTNIGMSPLWKKMRNFIKLCVTGQVSTKLLEQIILLEQQCSSNCYYSRWECLQLSGLLNPLEHKLLEETLLKICQNTSQRKPSEKTHQRKPVWENLSVHSLKVFIKLDVEIEFSNNEDCYWLSNREPKRVIIKFPFSLIINW